jgi:superfamily II DNA or RNA helicase
MSRKVLIENLSDKLRKTINKDLQITIEPSRYAFGAQPTFIYPFEVINDSIYVPFSYNREFTRPARNTFSKRLFCFNGTLRSEQQDIKSEVIKNLNKYGSTTLALYTGGGKTCISINIASKIHLKSLIIVHRIVLVNQWKKSIIKFCPTAKVQVLTSKSEMKDDIDFYIMNAINIPKHPRSFYKDIGMVVVDECHIILAEKLSKCMLHITPRYVLGLSATPYRVDGLNMLFDLYFGKEKIFRKLWHPHTVYCIDSGFTPKVEYAQNGKVNWGVILDSQCNNTKRNEMIIRLVKLFPSRVFLILSKRVSQAEYLVKRLREEKEDVTSLIGKQQEYEQSSRILVGTSGKAGVGFDHPRLNTLILASDVEQYFIQYLGRIFRTKEVEPVIFDIIDNNPILKKHFRTRRSVYSEHGGIIKNFNNEYQDFFKK